MHSKLRRRPALAGPLEPYAAEFDKELARLGYTAAGIRRKFEVASHLSRWLGERGMTAGDLDAEAIGEFVAERRAAGYPSQLTGRSLTWMLDYLRGIRAVRPAAASPEPATVTEHLLERFGVFLTAERGLASKTRRAHLNEARRFLAACGITGEAGLPVGILTAPDVTAWLAGMARIQAPGTNAEHREHAPDVLDLALFRGADHGPARHGSTGGIQPEADTDARTPNQGRSCRAG